jgi:hypothetical protein
VEASCGQDMGNQLLLKNRFVKSQDIYRRIRIAKGKQRKSKTLFHFFYTSAAGSWEEKNSVQVIDGKGNETCFGYF